MKLLPHERKILCPYDPKEAIDVSVAARIAGVTSRTIRNWCEDHGIGRKVGGTFRVSRIALRLFLDGDRSGLEAYHRGARTVCVKSETSAASENMTY